jgi:hypothetical protein
VRPDESPFTIPFADLHQCKPVEFTASVFAKPIDGGGRPPCGQSVTPTGDFRADMQEGQVGKAVPAYVASSSIKLGDARRPRRLHTSSILSAMSPNVTAPLIQTTLTLCRLSGRSRAMGSPWRDRSAVPRAKFPGHAG